MTTFSFFFSLILFLLNKGHRSLDELSCTFFLLSFACSSRFDCGMGEGVVRSEQPVALNTWNTVTVYRDGWTAWLTLNGGQQVSGQSRGLFTQITFQQQLFVGGSPNMTLVASRTNSFTGLTGCIRKLEINGRQYDFRADNRGDSIDGVDIGKWQFQLEIFFPCHTHFLSLSLFSLAFSLPLSDSFFSQRAHLKHLL